MKETELLNMDFANKNIVIIGKPSSGKTYISNIFKLKYPNHNIIHTDDYLHLHEDKAIQQIINEVQNVKYIIEGVLAYKILLQGQITNLLIPNVVINMDISYPKLKSNYKNRLGNIESIKGFCYRNQKIQNEWMSKKNNSIQFINFKSFQTL